MILSFKDQFKKPILEGTKIHTIRDDKHDRWYEGRRIQMATGVRTSMYNMFKEGICTGIQDIFMTNDAHFECSIDDKYLYYTDLAKLSFNDGFESIESFKNWFIRLIESSPQKCYSGKIIHWTDFKY